MVAPRVSVIKTMVGLVERRRADVSVRLWPGRAPAPRRFGRPVGSA